MNDAAANNSLQWQHGRLEHGFVRRKDREWSVEEQTAAVWYSGSGSSSPDEPGYRTGLDAGLEFPDGMPCFGLCADDGRPCNVVAEFPTHYLTDLDFDEYANAGRALPMLDPLKPIIGWAPYHGYACHAVYRRKPGDNAWIGTTFQLIDDQVPKELTQDPRSAVFRSYLRQRSNDYDRAWSQFLSNPFRFNRWVKPLEVIYKDGRVVPLISAPKECDFSELIPVPTEDQSRLLMEGLTEE